ncbi:MAG: class I tRNA ligase family protein, partial [Oscillospiraceae bacterium]|nr:class I tRNA ligase family protein [Oscillospiraceae bacterium]
DMYLEGLDQYRGWFQAALLTAVGSTGVAQAPFKTCVTHGWTVDGEGKAMHKSLGNGMDPYEIMDKYGADLLRLWAASADYHADVRCSDAIFKQLSQNYLKFRNTARYCLGNLDGFDPNVLTPAAEMEELDRWAVTRLNALMEKCFAAYDDYEFLAITHAVNDFCVVDMSNFYLDIIKDRLYCEERDGAKRRSAQTALYLILDTMTKLMAPILCFTCDEIWQSMAHKAGDDARNVLFNDMNQPFADYALSADAMAKWDKIIAVRAAVNGVLETARAEKKIGKALEAAVSLTVPSEDAFLAEMDADALADLLIVSRVDVTVGGELSASVRNAEGAKCPRCWKHSTQPGTDDLCPRCAAVVAKLPQF